VIAPSLIPKRKGDRIKTDKRDARRLAGLHRAGQLVAIAVPSPTQEAVRDLCRLRGDMVEDLTPGPESVHQVPVAPADVGQWRAVEASSRSGRGRCPAPPRGAVEEPGELRRWVRRQV